MNTEQLKKFEHRINKVIEALSNLFIGFIVAGFMSTFLLFEFVAMVWTSEYIPSTIPFFLKFLHIQFIFSKIGMGLVFILIVILIIKMVVKWQHQKKK